jgi:hypothetical protein
MLVASGDAEEVEVLRFWFPLTESPNYAIAKWCNPLVHPKLRFDFEMVGARGFELEAFWRRLSRQPKS